MFAEAKRTMGTLQSEVVTNCQLCGSTELEPVMFLGYLPPVNGMPEIGSTPTQETAFPAQLLYCPKCHLVQLGLIVDPQILFPPEYPYSSGTTKILRENFYELFTEVQEKLGPKLSNLVVDIGSNDGTLLSNFHEAGFKVCGIEPTNMGEVARSKGINTLQRFFDQKAADEVLKVLGQANLVTAANVFAHIENIHAVVEAIVSMLAPNGVFVSESHYLPALIDTLQYDTIYHEHLRYYSLLSLSYLMECHGLEIFDCKEIPTHGGSIRVYACRKGEREISVNVERQREKEYKMGIDRLETYQAFKKKVAISKLELLALLRDLIKEDKVVYAIGAPSRASTLINYVGLDDSMVNRVLEIKGSSKIGKYMPGTTIPVLDEQFLFDDQPDYALLLSWHIAEELMPKLKSRGYKGAFIVPLPHVQIID